MDNQNKPPLVDPFENPYEAYQATLAERYGLTYTPPAEEAVDPNVPIESTDITETEAQPISERDEAYYTLIKFVAGARRVVDIEPPGETKQQATLQLEVAEAALSQFVLARGTPDAPASFLDDEGDTAMIVEEEAPEQQLAEQLIITATLQELLDLQAKLFKEKPDRLTADLLDRVNSRISEFNDNRDSPRP